MTLAGAGHFPKDSAWILQDHRPRNRQGETLPTHLRAVMLACRVSARDPFGRFVVEGHEGDESGSERSVGDVGLGSVLWPAASVEKRRYGAWFFAAPAVTAEPSRDLRPPKTVSDGKTQTRDNPQTESRGTRADLAAQRVRVRPIGREDFRQDGRFAVLDPALSPSGSPLPKGWPGLVISATDELKQREVFLPAGGGLLCSVNAGQHPEVGSQVFDTDGDGALDPTRVGRLNGFVRVARIGPGALAWQLTRSDKDGLDGYGLAVGRGTVATPETPPPPPPTTGATATGGGGTSQREATPGGTGFQIGGVTDLRRLETPPRIDGQAGGVVRIDPATGRPVPATQTRQASTTSDATTARDGSGKPTPTTFASALVYAYTGAEKGGPLHVGALADKHRLGVTADGEPINKNHFNPLAPWFMDPERDGPMDFEYEPYSRPGPRPYRTPVHLRWDGAVAKWRWEAESFWTDETSQPPPIPDPRPPRRPPPLVNRVPFSGLGRPVGFTPPGGPIGAHRLVNRVPGAIPGGSSVTPLTGIAAEVVLIDRAAQAIEQTQAATAGLSTALGGFGTGIRDGPSDAPPQRNDILTPTAPSVILNSTGSEIEPGQTSPPCYPSGSNKTRMGPLDKPRRYASTTQAVILGGGLYHRAYSTSRGSPDLATSTAKGPTSRGEEQAPLVHHEAVVGAGPTRDWCRWRYSKRADKTGLAVAPGALVELPPDLTAADYLDGRTSPNSLTAYRVMPPGLAALAFSGVDASTGLPTSGFVLRAPAGGGSFTSRYISGPGVESAGTKQTSAGKFSTIDSSGSDAAALTPTGGVTLKEQAAPSTPAAGFVEVYAKADGKVYAKDDAGTETDLSASGSGGKANISADPVAAIANNVCLYGPLGQAVSTSATGPSVERLHADVLSDGANFNGTRGCYIDSGGFTENPAGSPPRSNVVNFAFFLPTLGADFSAVGTNGFKVKVYIDNIVSGVQFELSLYAAKKDFVYPSSFDPTAGGAWTQAGPLNATAITADVGWIQLQATGAQLAGIWVAGDSPVIVLVLKYTTDGTTANVVRYLIGSIAWDTTG